MNTQLVDMRQGIRQSREISEILASERIITTPNPRTAEPFVFRIAASPRTNAADIVAVAATETSSLKVKATSGIAGKNKIASTQPHSMRIIPNLSRQVKVSTVEIATKEVKQNPLITFTPKPSKVSDSAKKAKEIQSASKSSNQVPHSIPIKQQKAVTKTLSNQKPSGTSAVVTETTGKDGCFVTQRLKNGSVSQRAVAIKSPTTSSIPIRRLSVRPTTSAGYASEEPSQGVSGILEPLPVVKHFGEVKLTEAIIGKGAFALVRKAVHCRTGVALACKTYPINKLQRPVEKQALKNEIEILAKLKHPGVVGFLGKFEAGIHIHLLMELCGSQNLEDFLHKKAGIWPTLSEIKQLFRKIVEIVSYLHKNNVVHRDLKLGNICFWDISTPKLVDFGLARIGVDSNFEELTGTAYYMAPEVLRKSKAKKAWKADVWALGIILFYLLSRKYPFDAETEKSLYQKILNVNPDMSEVSDASAADLISRLLCKTQDARPSCVDILKHPYLAEAAR